MENTRPLIFISNDDGVYAPGLEFLISTVSRLGDIVAVAPAQPHSGMSSAITVNAPLRINEIEQRPGVKIYSVSGTPVDCVKLGLHAIVPRRPDIMLSGINHGSNSGNSVIYSGTMGAAMEACMVGIPAVGFSLLHHSIAADFSQTAPLVEKITRKVLEQHLPPEVCLNVNFPAKCEIKGLKVTEAARGYWTEEFKEYLDPQGKPFYWLTGKFNNLEPDNPDTDEYWLSRCYATAVPVTVNQTATASLKAMRSLLNF